MNRLRLIDEGGALELEYLLRQVQRQEPCEELAARARSYIERCDAYRREHGEDQQVLDYRNRVQQALDGYDLLHLAGLRLRGALERVGRADLLDPLLKQDEH